MIGMVGVHGNATICIPIQCPTECSIKVPTECIPIGIGIQMRCSPDG